MNNVMIPKGWIKKTPTMLHPIYSLTAKGLDVYKKQKNKIELGNVLTPKDEKPLLFLCHASEDKTRVQEIYLKLKEAGLRPWLDKEDLLPGQNWTEEIPKAISASNFVLIFFSKVAVAKRGYVQKEFKLALEVLDETPEDKISIIPVRLDNCGIPNKFKHLHYIDLFEESGFEKIIKAVKRELGT